MTEQRNAELRKLGDLQLAILQVLWRRGQATVGEVLNDLVPRRSLAYTTVATMLRKMEARDLVCHSKEGRTYIYKAKHEESSVSKTMTTDLVERLFEGSISSLVSHFLSTRDLSASELDRLEEIIKQRKRSKKGN